MDYIHFVADYILLLIGCQQTEKIFKKVVDDLMFCILTEHSSVREKTKKFQIPIEKQEKNFGSQFFKPPPWLIQVKIARVKSCLSNKPN